MGVLMYELYSGQGAHALFSHAPPRALAAAVADAGVRPAFPPHCPRWYAELAARCMHARPSQRPSFRRVAAALAAADDVAP